MNQKDKDTIIKLINMIDQLNNKDEVLKRLNTDEESLNSLQQNLINQDQTRELTDKNHLLEKYYIYRDHIKHEDNLLNQRINILLASQSFLFFPYFSILKDYKNNGYSGYDSLLLLGICCIGIGINILIRPSIRGFIDASSHIKEIWKKRVLSLSQLKSSVSAFRYNVKYNPDEHKLTKPESYLLNHINPTSEDVGFIKSDADDNYIPNITYENPIRRLRWQIHNLTNQLPHWLMLIWVLLFIIPVFGFSWFSNQPKNYSWQKIWDSNSFDPNIQLFEPVTLEEIFINRVYQAELNNQINDEIEKTKDRLTKKLERCKYEIITAHPPLKKEQIEAKLNSCFDQ